MPIMRLQSLMRDASPLLDHTPSPLSRITGTECSMLFESFMSRLDSSSLGKVSPKDRNPGSSTCPLLQGLACFAEYRIASTSSIICCTASASGVHSAAVASSPRRVLLAASSCSAHDSSFSMSSHSVHVDVSLVVQ